MGQIAEDVLRFDHAEMLRRARCTACHTRGAVEARLVWVALEAERPDVV